MTDTNTSPPEFRDRIKAMRKIPIARIREFAAGNPVERTELDIALLDASLDENGYAMPVEVRELPDGWYETLDGHGRIGRIRERWPDVTELQAIILDVETAAEGRKLLLGLRHSAEWGMAALDDWMRAGLKAGELDVDIAMKLSGLTAAHLDSFAEAGQDALNRALEQTNERPISPADATAPQPTLVADVDIADELPRQPVTRPGDVWILGSSRLVCGDATTRTVVDRALNGAVPDLLLSDPPWNASVIGGDRKLSADSEKKQRITAGKKRLKNDSLGAGFPKFVGAFVTVWSGVCPPGTPAYVCMSPDEWATIDLAMRGAGWHWSTTIIWNKNSLVLSRKDFHPQYEPLWYGWREGAPRKCSPADRAVSDVWPCDRPRKSEAHPTMKPIALFGRAINASSKPGEVVLDTFAGSGTTLLAAEQLGRRAALVELDPAYCDVIVDRFQRLTGKKASRSGA